MNPDHMESGITDYYTPAHIIEAARQTLGAIDLDPASCAMANQTVRAAGYYTADQDGLSLPWFGRVWLNHPFGRSLNDAWINKLLYEYQTGAIEAACCITWANVGTNWFSRLTHFPQCFPRARVKYLRPDAPELAAPPKGSVITYLGDDLPAFRAAFEKFGVVK